MNNKQSFEILIIVEWEEPSNLAISSLVKLN